MTEQCLAYVRRFNQSRDAVPTDRRGEGKPKSRGIYLHHFGTGHQELVFDSPDEARAFAQREGIAFIYPRRIA